MYASYSLRKRFFITEPILTGIEKPIDEERIKRIVSEILNRGEKASKLPERIYLHSLILSTKLIPEKSFFSFGQRIISTRNKSIRCIIAQPKASSWWERTQGVEINFSIESLTKLCRLKIKFVEKKPKIMYNNIGNFWMRSRKLPPDSRKQIHLLSAPKISVS